MYRYREEETPVTPFVPRTEDLLDTSDLTHDPWVQQPVVGVQGGPCGTNGVVCPSGELILQLVVFFLFFFLFLFPHELFILFAADVDSATYAHQNPPVR